MIHTGMNIIFLFYKNIPLIKILHRADAQGNDMSERLQARVISLGKHVRSKSQVIIQKGLIRLSYGLALYFEHERYN